MAKFAVRAKLLRGGVGDDHYATRPIVNCGAGSDFLPAHSLRANVSRYVIVSNTKHW